MAPNDTLYESADEQHIQRFLSANCFGDWVGRGGIDIPTRELLTFSMLAALGGCDPQVKVNAIRAIDEVAPT